jgi:XTP/dITP diphosphohydrolase
MNRLFVATGNAHKTAEIGQMLGSDWVVEDLRAYPKLVAPDETGSTFAENAKIKAEAASKLLPELWVLSDDSGLEVDALGGEPGVYSARYAGPAATDADNRARLKRELAVVAQDEAGGWRGRFRCCMAVARGGVTQEVFEGKVEGKILPVEQGQGGFGYDSLFVPVGYDATFGLLSAEVKNALSHRAQALYQVRAWLHEQL